MKKKKVLISLSIVGILLTIFIILNYINSDRVIIASEKRNNSFNNDTFSFMLETAVDSYEYSPSTNNSWPGKGYEFN